MSPLCGGNIMKSFFLFPFFAPHPRKDAMRQRLRIITQCPHAIATYFGCPTFEELLGLKSCKLHIFSFSSSMKFFHDLSTSQHFARSLFSSLANSCLTIWSNLKSTSSMFECFQKTKLKMYYITIATTIKNILLQNHMT